MCQVIYCTLVEMLKNKKILVFRVHLKKPIIIDESTKKKSVEINRAPLLNIDEQHLKNTICEDIDEIEDDKEDKLTSEEDITQQDR